MRTAAALPERRKDRAPSRTREIERISRPVIEDAWKKVPTESRQSLREVSEGRARDPRRAERAAIPVGKSPATAPARDDEPSAARRRAGEALQRAQEAVKMDEQRQAGKQAAQRRAVEIRQRAEVSRRSQESMQRVSDRPSLESPGSRRREP